MTQARLNHPRLGTLELGCDPFVVTNLQVGSPAVRVVQRPRALADGVFDDSTYEGARAVTLSLRLRDNSAVCDTGETSTMQQLLDKVMPYMSPRVRPTLEWALPGSPLDVRRLTVRGDTWPFSLAGKRYQLLALGFVAPDGIVTSAVDSICVPINPSADVENGRVYSEDYTDGGRGPYPATGGIGARFINQIGTGRADWVLSLYGAVTNPTFSVNGTVIKFNRNGGQTLLGGSSVVLDTRNRTILLNGDPAFPVYDKVNYDEWQWDDLKLESGINLVRLGADVLTSTSTATICYTPTWA